MTPDRTAAELGARAARLDAGALWAASGAMALTGDADGPPLVIDAPVAALAAAAGELLGGPTDAPALLGERAAIFGFRRRGQVSCGGGTRLLPAADGWVAVGLPRPVDRDALPAWLGLDPADADPWPAVARAVAASAAAALAEGAHLLEVPFAVLGERAPAPVPWRVSHAAPGPAVRAPVVVDLSALWAGPLCAQLVGGDVIKVEDPARPDGSRHAPHAFMDVLNGGKRSVAISLRTVEGRRDLARLLAAADVVVSSSRPRAFDALGVDVAAVIAGSPTVWVAITAHGWDGPGRDRVGFGDDTAVAAGLVATAPDGAPRFAADAVADPLAGILAAVITRTALDHGGSWFIDAPLAGAAAFAQGLATPKAPNAPAGLPAAPRARRPTTPAHPLGADTAAALAELGRT